MFLRIQEIKRLMKEAYKDSGLVVGRFGEETPEIPAGIYVGGRTWSLYVRITHFPKELHAAIIELTAELPEPGHVVEYSDSWEQEALGIDVDPSYNLPEMMRECTEKYEKSHVYLETSVGLYTCLIRADKRRAAYVESKYINAITERILRKLGRIDSLLGPVSGTSLRGRIMWTDDEWWFSVLEGEPAEINDLIETWRGIDLTI